MLLKYIPKLLHHLAASKQSMPMTAKACCLLWFSTSICLPLFVFEGVVLPRLGYCPQTLHKGSNFLHLSGEDTHIVKPALCHTAAQRLSAWAKHVPTWQRPPTRMALG